MAKVEKVDCDLPNCDATWWWVNRPEGVVAYLRPSNGLRGSRHVEAECKMVDSVTTDDYLWLFECPFCGHAESDPIEPE